MGNEDPGRMRCEHCLSYIEPGSRFCSQCGTPIASAGSSSLSDPGRGRTTFRALAVRSIVLVLLVAAGTYGGYLLYQLIDPSISSDGNRSKQPETAEQAPRTQEATPPATDDRTKIPESGSGESGTAGFLTPDALLARVGPGVSVFVGMDSKGVEFARAAAVDIDQGLALPAVCLKGSYLGWLASTDGTGREAQTVVYYDEMLGGALLQRSPDQAGIERRDPSELTQGARIFQIRPGDKGRGPAILPGVYAGPSYAPDTGANRHLFAGAPPTHLGAVIIDEAGRFLGLAAPGAKDDPFSFIPSVFFEAGARRGSMSLADLNAIYFEGSFDALVREARARRDLGALAEALDLFEQARLRNPHRGRDLEEEILNVVLNLADQLLRSGAANEALDICTRKAPEFSFSSQLILCAFRAAAQLQDFAVASEWILEIESLEPGLYEKLLGEHVSLYLAWSGSLLHREQRREALAVIREGLSLRPWSAVLHETHGNLLKSLRDYRGAASAYQEASRLDPDRAHALAQDIELCLELQGRPGTVAIDFDPDDHIYCRGLIDGRVWVDFIVDTGASVTSIPTAAAEQLGINLKHVNRRARIVTAGGEIEVPYILVKNVDVGGLVVKQPYIIVNDLPEPETGYGLLGLNFLEKFVYKIDHQSGRMTIRPQ